MKRIISIVMIAMLVTACGGTEPSIDTADIEVVTSGQTMLEEEPKSDYSEAEHSYEYPLNFTNMVNLSSHIVLATPVEVIEFDRHTSRYVFSVDKEIKGKCDKEINVYGEKGHYETGTQYALFLEVARMAFYDHDVYSNVYPVIVEVNSDKEIARFVGTGSDVINDTVINSIDTVKTLEKLVKEHDDGKKTNKYVLDDGSIDSEDIQSISDLIDITDYIAVITVEEIGLDKNNIAIATCRIKKSYKGEFNKMETIMLPSDSINDDELLVFLAKTESGNFQVNSLVSVVDKSNKDYEKLVKELAK